MELQTLFGRTLNLNWIPQDFDTFPISFCHALVMELQTLFGRMLNLNWIPPRLWHISDIFSPCSWYGVADAFWSYTQPKLDTPLHRTLNLNWIPPRIWHISNIFSPCPWYGVADAFWSYAQPKLDTPKNWYISIAYALGQKKVRSISRCIYNSGHLLHYFDYIFHPACLFHPAPLILQW